MSSFELTYKPLGDRSVLVEWPAKIDKKILDDVLNFKNSLKNYYIKQSVQINSSYSSLLISYNIGIENIYNEILTLKSLYNTRKNLNKRALKHWEIPVCYDVEFGIDLEEISSANKLSKTEIIERHFKAVYTVYFIGFLPGFLYLGGLDKKLHFPRKSAPRLMVKKGAVGIGGNQTGIYPNESPGGWNIIGNSPLNFFDINKEEPCFAKAGDTIRFFNVGLKDYLQIKDEVDKGIYQIKNRLIYD